MANCRRRLMAGFLAGYGLAVGAPAAFATFCGGSSLPRNYVSGGTNELMGEVALSCSSVSAVQHTITVSYGSTVTTGTGMMTSSVPFVVQPSRGQSGSSITFTFTPSSGDQTFSIFGVGVNASFVSSVSANWSGTESGFPFSFTNTSGQVGIAVSESAMVASGIKGRVDSTPGLSGAGGSQVLIPVSARLFSGVNANSLSFQLKVISNGTAPALSGTLSFNNGAGLPAPGVDTSGGANVITVSWGGLSISGITALGSVVMNVPGNVGTQPSYTLQVTQASSSAGTVYGGPTYILSTTAAPKRRRAQRVSE